MVCKKKQDKVRLYYEGEPLKPGKEVALEEKSAHYVRDVMRVKSHNTVVLFDGMYGDWACAISEVSRSGVVVRVECLLREYVSTDSLTLCIALVKHETMRSIVRQATEMGVTHIQPMVTEYSVLNCLNIQKCKLWAIEAAEQCGRHDIPEIAPIIRFEDLKGFGQHLVLCDETGHGQMPCDVLRGKDNVGVVIGPEGGFSSQELNYAGEFCSKMSLGSTILRVDTAVVAALAHVNEHYALNKARTNNDIPC